MKNNLAEFGVNNYAEYADSLRKSLLFSDLDRSLLNEFLSMSKCQSFPKNSVIYNIEGKADWFYFIINGWVKTSRQTLDGEEAIIDILGKDEVFGHNALFEDFIHTATAEVIENAEIIQLPIGLLADKIDYELTLAKNLLKLGSVKTSLKDREIEHLSAQTAPQRIGCFLLRLCDLSKEKQNFELPFDKLLIASKLGMKPETFSRALNKLKEETGISVNGKNFEIPSLDVLSHFCCNACSSNFPCEDKK